MASNSNLDPQLFELTDPTKGAEEYIKMLFQGVLIGDVQRQEVTKAFIAGVLWLQTIELDLITQLNDDVGTVLLQHINQKCAQFALALPDNGKGGLSVEPYVPPPGA